jgi:Zn-dependent protease
MSDEELLRAVAARGEDATNKSSSNGLLLLTAALFLGLGGLRWGWQTVLYLAVAVALHELGHVLAMRIFGYKNVRMLFLPLFGGLATGEPRELDATRNALVSLAGPVLGLLTALFAGGLSLFIHQPWLIHFAWVSLILNAFNLLPLVPLDGGQFTNDALFSRHPVLELIFRLLAIVGLVWMAIGWGSWAFGVLAGFMLLTTGYSFRRACMIRDARKDPTWQTRVLDLETIVRLREMVTRLFAKVVPSKYQKALPEHVHGVWLEIRERFPGSGVTVGLMLGYFACLITIPIIAVLLAFVRKQSGG